MFPGGICMIEDNIAWVGIFFPFFFFKSSLLLSSSTRRRFYLPPAILWTSRGDRCHPFPPPVRAFTFIAHRVQHSHCSSIFIEIRMLLTHALALSASQLFARKSPYEYVHSVRIEPTKLILVGTRITYQATGDAGICAILYPYKDPAQHILTVG